MDYNNHLNPYNTDNIDFSVLKIIPQPIKHWAESLPLEQRSYLLLLCHLLSVANAETKTDFLDDYAADSLIAKMLEDKVPQKLVSSYLKKFYICQDINYFFLKKYIRQFYIHSAQDLHQHPDLYLKIVLNLFYDIQERNKLFSYILGFEIIQMMFQMSWLQHERLYLLQRKQESFIKAYIKPIQHAHRINGIIVPKHEKVFFAKRNYFVKQPNIKPKKLIELVMATFTIEQIVKLGFSLAYDVNFLVFDYEYIFKSEPKGIFPC